MKTALWRWGVASAELQGREQVDQRSEPGQSDGHKRCGLLIRIYLQPRGNGQMNESTNQLVKKKQTHFVLNWCQSCQIRRRPQALKHWSSALFGIEKIYASTQNGFLLHHIHKIKKKTLSCCLTPWEKEQQQFLWADGQCQNLPPPNPSPSNSAQSN